MILQVKLINDDFKIADKLNLRVEISDEIPIELAKKVADDFCRAVGDAVDVIPHKLGHCPKCGKFFYKKRKDTLYCSERCRTNSLQDRHRKKVKSFKSSKRNS